MRSLGEFLKEARVARKYSLEELSEETKIKKGFLRAIEAEQWDKLPTGTVVAGFVKNMASSLGLPREKVMAMYRRDYSLKGGLVNPKPDVERKMGWSPRLTFLLGMGLVGLVVIGYLGIQYRRFSREPELVVSYPRPGEVLREEVVTVVGRADAEAAVSVNNQPAYIDETGEFREEVEVNDELTLIKVRAVSRAGKETRVEIPVEVDL
jgi:transcriptional regulator with XRE-family HTH domain